MNENNIYETCYGDYKITLNNRITRPSWSKPTLLVMAVTLDRKAALLIKLVF